MASPQQYRKWKRRDRVIGNAPLILFIPVPFFISTVKPVWLGSQGILNGLCLQSFVLQLLFIGYSSRYRVTTT